MSQRVRTLLVVALLVAGVLATAAASLRSEQQGLPLDPDSAGPTGTLALVQVLEELGTEVRQEPVESLIGDLADGDVLLFLRDVLSADERDEVEDWVAAGGTLVLADPLSPLAPTIAGPRGGLLPLDLERGCDVAGLADVDTVDPGGSALLFEVPQQATGCYTEDWDDEEASWLVVEGQGDGVLVALGGPEPLTNGLIAAAGHPQLVAALLAPSPGTVVGLPSPSTPGAGGGPTGPQDLIALGVGLALLQLCVAFLAVIWWRTVRHGRVVEEPQPAALPASELVGAVGSLWQTRRATDRAHRALRDAAGAQLRQRVGLPGAASDEDLAHAVASRGARTTDDVRAVLGRPAPADDAALVAAAAELDQLRTELDRLHTPAEPRTEDEPKGAP